MKHLIIACFVGTLAGAAFGPVASLAQDMSTAPVDASACATCHNDTTLIVSKQAQFNHSLHGTGESFIRGGNANCAGCHGSEAAEARIAAGLMPHDSSIQGVVNVSPYTCRTCHDIHKTYTKDDWALTGKAAPVEIETTGTTFDGGDGNLCAECHQIRNELPQAANGQIEFTTTRFGTHHGVEASMLLGEGSLGFRSRPSVHYSKVEDTCVACHMGKERNHTFEPALAGCESCHKGIESLDYEGVQTEISGMLDEVKKLLIARGIMNEENRSIPGAYPEEVASAMWNYMFVLEDQSKGVHHPDYARQLLQYGLDNL